MEESPVLTVMERLVPDASLDRESLLALAKIISVLIDVPFQRMFTRRRSLIVKWFDMNLEKWEPLSFGMYLYTSPTAARARRSMASTEDDHEGEEIDDLSYLRTSNGGSH
jgi:hypothetical protein